METGRTIPLATRGAMPRGRHALSEEQWDYAGRRLRLSRREMQISKCIFDDLKESAIGRGLGISPHTVHTHLERLYHKLGVRSRLALVVRVVSEINHAPRTAVQTHSRRPKSL
ncbi:transcriptional regulator NarL [Phycisphaerae bacterium RAS2]|nr:transcriptional regulator NarL [Phycisphaerae bacterium RAS2]